MNQGTDLDLFPDLGLQPVPAEVMSETTKAQTATSREEPATLATEG
jgi:hypothetical protein